MTTQAPPPVLLFTRESLSNRWDGKSTKTLRRMEMRGELIPIIIGGRVHYRESDIVVFEKESEVK
jgi:hypothetical protein